MTITFLFRRIRRQLIQIFFTEGRTFIGGWILVFFSFTEKKKTPLFSSLKVRNREEDPLFSTKSKGGARLFPVAFGDREKGSARSETNPRFFEDRILCSLKGAGVVSIRQSRIEGLISF